MSYSVDKYQNIWQAKISEILTDDDIIGLKRKLQIFHEGYALSANGLVDLRTLTDMDIDLSTLNNLTSEMEVHLSRNEIKMAFMVESPIQYGIARMFRIILSPWKTDVRLFEEEKEALEWISV